MSPIAWIVVAVVIVVALTVGWAALKQHLYDLGWTPPDDKPRRPRRTR